MLIDRSRRAPSTPTTRDRGASSLEYGALIVVAALVVGILGTLVSTKAEGHITTAMCDLFRTECAGGTGDKNPGKGDETPGEGDETPGEGGSSSEPTPTPTPTISPTPGASEEEVETIEVLNETQLGRDALQWVRDHGVRVEYRSGGGSYYDSGDNVFYIDTSQSPEERANTFVHEVNHAEHPDEPDIDDLDREDFIEQSIDEEVEGTVEAIQNNQQLQENRDGNSPDTLLQSEYETAYDDAVERENEARQKAGRPPLDEAGEREVGERAGRERVEQAFENGEVVSSVDHDTYADNYGEAWDDAHECTLWIFC